MQEVIRTNDPVLMSYVQSILHDAGIKTIDFDNHTSSLEGTAGAIQRRLMVADSDVEKAQGVLATAEMP